ncbi:MAG TPA: tetratricopeptide repeat protein [Pyrinomonadaceae bacterium]|nr:tetratricopeptide repeat protein [Pyrinomonadaceae bacterium]
MTLTAAPSCLLALFLLAAPAAGARQQSGAGERAQSQAAPAAAPQQLSERERRAKAYAKMLEGQRHFSGVRTGTLTVEGLRRAQAAFKEAAELDPTLAEAHTALAEIALFFDDLAQAEESGRTAARINPDNLGAHRILSRVYTVKSKLGDSAFNRAAAEQAVAELREVARIRPSDAEAHALLAELYLATNREAEAVAALRRWAELPASLDNRFYQLVTKGRELSPDAANARLGEVLLRSGKPAEAAAAIRRAMSLEPDNPRYLEMLGEALEAGGSADQGVVNELSRLVAQQPQNTVAVGMLARAQSRAGRVDDGVATLRAGIAAVKPGEDRDRLNLQLQLANLFDEAGRYDEAVGVYEEMLRARNIGTSPLASERDRRFASAVIASIVNLRQQAGQPEQAAAAVERLRGLLGSSDPAAEIQAVNLLRSQGKRDEALETVRAARKRFPEEPRLLRLEAFTLADLGRVEEALGLIRPRLKGQPSDYDEYVVIASLLMGAGRGAEAVEAARKALDLAPADDPDRATNALLLLSSAQERAGDAKASEETLRRILAKEPDNATALNNLGYFLTERNERLEEALEMIQRAVRAEPTNASFLDSLGWVYFKLGKLPEAERYLSDAARRNPSSVAIQEHLGDLFERRGQREKALAAWRKALALATEAADTARIKAKLNGSPNK